MWKSHDLTLVLFVLLSHVDSCVFNQYYLGHFSLFSGLPLYIYYRRVNQSQSLEKVEQNNAKITKLRMQNCEEHGLWHQATACESRFCHQLALWRWARWLNCPRTKLPNLWGSVIKVDWHFLKKVHYYIIVSSSLEKHKPLENFMHVVMRREYISTQI